MQDAEARNCIRTMLSAFFPQQDCVPLPTYRRSGSGCGLVPNHLLDGNYVTQLGALRQRVLGAPRVKSMHVRHQLTQEQDHAHA
jgi:hypothetical protein